MNEGGDYATETPLRSRHRGYAAKRCWKPHTLALLDALKITRQAAGAGTMLLHQGDRIGHVLVLFDGWVIESQVFRDGRRQILDVLLPGRIFGFEALLRGEARYSVTALTDAVYGTIDRGSLPLFSNRHPEFAGVLLEVLLEEHESAHRRLAWMGHYTAEERLAALLVDLHARLTTLSLVRDDGSFPLPLTQQQLADLMGFNVVHVNRVLRRLRARRLVTLEEQVVQIHDPASLARIVPMQNGSSRPH
jgi:CRP/FNR family transcriptional regulator, anaerobic regulatory protein